MIERFNAVVLRMIKYSDSLMIADVYTQSRGRLSFLVPVSRSKRSKVRSVLFQPLSMLTFNAAYREGKGLCRLVDAQPYAYYSTIPYDVVKSSIALYLAEMLSNILHEEGENEPLFAYLDYALNWFDSAREGYADFHILFLVHLTRYLGISPNVESFVPGSCFDLLAGCLVSKPPLHAQYLSPEDTRNFIALLNVDFDALPSVALNRKARGEYLTLLQNYYRLHIPGFSEPKSAEVLREIFDY